MKIKYILLLVCMLSANAIHAKEDKYEICYINGFFTGEGDKFMSGLATHIAAKKKVLTDPACTAASQKGLEIGIKYPTSGEPPSEQEGKIILSAHFFREKVNKAISELIGY